MAESSVLTSNGIAATQAELPFLELGSSGLRQYGGYIREEFLTELSGPRGMRKYREMAANDAIIGAVLYAIEQMVRRVSWRLEPADDSVQAAQLATLVQGMLFDDLSQSWPMLLSEILSLLTYGWSYHEIVYKRRTGPTPPPGREDDPTWAPSRFTDGLIGWRKFPIRGQDSLLRWAYSPGYSLEGMVQHDPAIGQGPVLIPIQKALLFRASAWKGNPEGRSILRNAYRAWYMKSRIENYEAIGIERKLAGIPLLELPVELFGTNLTAAQTAQFAAFKALGSNVRQDAQACILWPLAFDEHGNKRYQFSLVSAAGSAQSQAETSRIIERYDTRILQSVLADVIMVGQNQRGSQALATTKSELFLLAITGLLDAIAEVFTTHAFVRLGALNGWEPTLLPTLVHSDLKEVDFDKFTLGVKNLTQAGMVLSAEDEAYVRNELGFPEAPLEPEAL